MEITQVRVFPVDQEKLKAYVSIIIDDCFVVSDIKIIHGTSGLFVSMPSKKRKNGTFRDIAHPLNNETRRWIERQIIEEYRATVADERGEEAGSLREIGQADESRARPETAVRDAASSESATETPARGPVGEDRWS